MMKVNKYLLGGSLILLISINFFNFMNFLFQFIMARLLSVADYGILATLFSIIYIFSLFIEAIQVVIVRYSSHEKDNGKLKNLFRRSAKRGFRYSFYLFLFYLVIMIPLSTLLKIDYALLSLTGLSAFIVFLLPISRGIMQGKKLFGSLGVNMALESILKLAIGIILVLIGFKVYGAIIGTLLGAFIAFLFSLINIRKILNSEEKTVKTDKILGYSKRTFIMIFTIMTFFSIDVVLAKILFSPEIAGSYALASVLAKMIFFGTLPIGKAMFPISSEINNKKEKSNDVFFNALGMLVVCIIVALIFFYFFSGFLIQVFSGKIVPEASQVLFFVGLAISIISLTNLILLYKLSINQTEGYYLLPIFILIEVSLMYIFSENLIVFSLAFVLSASAFLLGAIVLVRAEE